MMSKLKKRLDAEVEKRNDINELSLSQPDPLMVARQNANEYQALICALFSYGNAKLIVKFLSQLDFSLLDSSEQRIRQEIKSYYRFQNSRDVQEIFIAMYRLKNVSSLEKIFLEAYQKEHNVLDGIFQLIKAIEEINPYQSRGYRFLVGKANQNSPYKRWLMYLRWMVRKDNLDLGLWTGVDKKDLLLPLDTHTFKVSQKLGLLQRKTYDLKAVIEVTQSLRKLDANDPIKYDFALYRLGQEKEI